MKFNVFLIYIRACTYAMVGFIFLCFCLNMLMALSTNIWLSKWTDDSKKEAMNNNTNSASRSRVHGLVIYSILGVGQGKTYRSKFERNLFILTFSSFFIGSIEYF